MKIKKKKVETTKKNQKQARKPPLTPATHAMTGAVHIPCALT